MAQEYGLQLVYKKEFHDIFQEEQDHKDFGPLLQRMKVVAANGESEMDEDQWEAASESFIFIGVSTCLDGIFRYLPGLCVPKAVTVAFHLFCIIIIYTSSCCRVLPSRLL